MQSDVKPSKLVKRAGTSMIHKLFPSGGSSPAHSFNVLFLSEGFLAGENAAFHTACIEFLDRLLTKSPFNITRTNPSWSNFYKLFLPSANSGPASGISSANRTIFESSFDITSARLSVNAARVAEVVDSETIEILGATIPLSEFIGKGSRFLAGRFLLVVLLPPNTNPNGGEYEHEAPSNSEYYFVATTQNGHWHQVVLRAIAAQLGLADEFERTGTEWIEPVERLDKVSSHLNVLYLPTLPLLNRDLPGWRSMISPAFQNAALSVHPHNGGVETPDNTTSPHPTMPDTIELWEGSGGFHTKMYRSAQDCLMRRQIGNINLSVRQNEVPFCRVCRKILQDVIK